MQKEAARFTSLSQGMQWGEQHFITIQFSVIVLHTETNRKRLLCLREFVGYVCILSVSIFGLPLNIA
jgi:hypothetical protein